MRIEPFIVCAVLAACGAEPPPPPEKPTWTGSEPAPLGCVPNLDGQLESDELKPALGVPVRFTLNPESTTRAVDVVGQVDGSGGRVWDFGTSWSDDAVATLSAQPLSGRWYAASFPSGQFVLAANPSGTVEGIYAHSQSALVLLGLASAQPAPPEGKTLLVYQAPVELYRFPLKPGTSWIAVGQVQNATVRGLPYAGRDTYEQSCDGGGELILEDLTFEQALRVRTRLTVEPAVGAAVVRRQISWVSECFGEVARATARDGEQNADFTTAAELRRLGL